MLGTMPNYVVTGFHNGTFRTFETKQQSVNDAISHAESLGVEIETIRCHAAREIYHKVGREWQLDKYMPTGRSGQPGEHNVLYLASFIIPLIGLGVGGYRAYCDQPGGKGALICGGVGLLVWGIGWMVISKFV